VPAAVTTMTTMTTAVTVTGFRHRSEHTTERQSSYRNQRE
jgi:hypothetical protein